MRLFALALFLWGIATSAWADGPIVALAQGRERGTYEMLRLQDGECASGVTAIVPARRAPAADDVQLNSNIVSGLRCAPETVVTHVVGSSWTSESPRAPSILDSIAASVPSLSDQRLSARLDAYRVLFGSPPVVSIPSTLPPSTYASAQLLRDALLTRAVSTAVESSRSATTRAELSVIVDRFANRMGDGATIEQNGRRVSEGRAMIQRQIAEALAPRLASFSRPPLWAFIDTFETRSEIDWRSSPNERRVMQGAPLSQFSAIAPTDTEIGLALLRALAMGGNTGSGSATWEGSSTVAISSLWYLPADYGGVRNIIHHVRKKSCRRERDGFRCIFDLWAELRLSQAQDDLISDMPESLFRLMFGPIMYMNNNPIEVDEFFRLTPQGWRAPEVESRTARQQQTNTELIAAGLRISANTDRCMALHIANDPSVHTDPNC